MKVFYTISFLILSFQSISQDSLTFTPKVKLDSINQKDSTGVKQGYWIIFGIDKPDKGYPDSLRIEEGNYLDDRKNGVWIKYNKDGVTPKLIGEFKKGRPHGNFSKYHSNGTLKAIGYYANGKHKGPLLRYYPSGCIMNEQNYNNDGKETGTSNCYYDCYSTTNYESNHLEKKHIINNKKLDSIFYYYPNGELKTENKKNKPFTLTSFDYQVYNSNDQIWLDGEFRNGKFRNGKLYKYDDNGFLIKIELWTNGEYYCDWKIYTYDEEGILLKADFFKCRDGDD